MVRATFYGAPIKHPIWGPFLCFGLMSTITLREQYCDQWARRYTNEYVIQTAQPFTTEARQQSYVYHFGTRNAGLWRQITVDVKPELRKEPKLCVFGDPIKLNTYFSSSEYEVIWWVWVMRFSKLLKNVLKKHRFNVIGYVREEHFDELVFGLAVHKTAESTTVGTYQREMEVHSLMPLQHTNIDENKEDQANRLFRTTSRCHK